MILTHWLIDKLGNALAAAVEIGYSIRAWWRS